MVMGKENNNVFFNITGTKLSAMGQNNYQIS